MAFVDPGPPKSPLGFYRVMAPAAGVRVSPLCLGAMNFGEAWSSFLGECNKETSFKMLDKFFDDGGNFIDTANFYQLGESEQWLGEWMAQRQNRDQIVLATKFATVHSPESKDIKVNYTGNHAKSLHLSLEASLKKLQTDYIDLLYIHWWDFTTSIPELMQSLHRVVASGKVLYLGISDTPAWIVSKANEYARQNGLTQFSVYQGLWSAMVRDLERDILPMCESEGMAIAPWGVVGRSLFKTDEELAATKDEGRKTDQATDKSRAVASALHALAKKKDTAITSVAIAYIRAKYPYVYPIIGGRKLEHLQQNIDALALALTDDEVDEIENAVPFDVGFPMSFLFEFNNKQTYRSRMTAQNIPILQMGGSLETARPSRGPTPHGVEAYKSLLR